MGRKSRKHVSKSNSNGSAAGARAVEGADLIALVNKVAMGLEREVLRQGLQVHLVICDSDAMYPVVFLLKEQAYRILDQERIASEQELEEFRRVTPSRNVLGKYIAHKKESMAKQHEYLA